MSQTHTRSDAGFSTPIVTDYAVNWKLFVPASQRDEFVTVEDLARTDTLVGTLNFLVYFQPSNDLYFLEPGSPAGIFTYNVTMKRFNNENRKAETDKAIYPFVWRNDGPVELDKYFGY